ncbi:hypothetical protein [Streptomyces sp. VRA16 Mangrove soil]|uniref:hypothetical protein n=1 Tax=Streptomyces sp. VRA16 Mangrove soil TaxID=2817434 RepID=UPI001A9F461F|nr:hypothetical protein [Streptomyces sp. VRA16 Mangrove soil]MBO1333804.1 hypothetical protein [Streptomyces sp. VRA16 Mangrove soil]
MESTPALFAGTVFALFGAGLVVWTGARTLHREPVLDGARPVAAAVLTGASGVASLALAVWCFGQT